MKNPFESFRNRKPKDEAIEGQPILNSETEASRQRERLAFERTETLWRDFYSFFLFNRTRSSDGTSVSTIPELKLDDGRMFTLRGERRTNSDPTNEVSIDGNRYDLGDLSEEEFATLHVSARRAAEQFVATSVAQRAENLRKVKEVSPHRYEEAIVEIRNFIQGENFTLREQLYPYWTDESLLNLLRATESDVSKD